MGLPSRIPSATRKSKRLDQAEWARRTDAAAWSPAQDAKAARRAGRLRSDDRDARQVVDAFEHRQPGADALHVAPVGGQGGRRRLGRAQVDQPGLDGVGERRVDRQAAARRDGGGAVHVGSRLPGRPGRDGGSPLRRPRRRERPAGRMAVVAGCGVIR